MKYEAIMFDLDGTLLPMDYDEFTKGYLGLLFRYACPFGYEKESFIAGMWKGVSAMTNNNGEKTNCEVFWETFGAIIGDYEKARGDEKLFDAFYDEGFHAAKAFTGENPRAREAVLAAREKADKVILATSPLFPMNAVTARLEWIGIDKNDFDLITEYNGFSHAKPNPKYYIEICEKMGLDPEKCLMIGNNVQEDVEGAAAVGMDTYLVTDWLMNSKPELPNCPRGSFLEMIDYIKNL